MSNFLAKFQFFWIIRRPVMNFLVHFNKWQNHSFPTISVQYLTVKLTHLHEIFTENRIILDQFLYKIST